MGANNAISSTTDGTATQPTMTTNGQAYGSVPPIAYDPSGNPNLGGMTLQNNATPMYNPTNSNYNGAPVQNNQQNQQFGQQNNLNMPSNIGGMGGVNGMQRPTNWGFYQNNQPQIGQLTSPQVSPGPNLDGDMHGTHPIMYNPAGNADYNLGNPQVFPAPILNGDMHGTNPGLLGNPQVQQAPQTRAGMLAQNFKKYTGR